MKKFLKFVGAVILVGAAGIAAVFFFTSGLVDVADEFFVAAREGDMDTAYANTSADFKRAMTQPDLARFLEQNGLDTYQEATWSFRSMEGGVGQLRGTVTAADGAIPLSLQFVKEDGTWKIQYIEKQAAGVSDTGNRPEMPEESEQVRLVRESISVFARSANAGGMTGLYRHISELWRGQTSVEELDEIFRAFIDAEQLDLTVLDRYTPQFTEAPLIDGNGVLRIKGFYPTEPDEAHFEQSYVYEGTGWKLIGFSLHIRPKGQDDGTTE